MKTSCISHPSNNRFSLLRQDYWDICETSELSQTARACAAKLLNVFEQWMNNKLQNTVQIKRYNRAAENEGLEPHTDDETDLWVYESADDLSQALVSEHPVKTIRQALSWLVSQNLLLRRNNPKFRWDKTYQYMLNVPALQERIDALNSPKSAHRVSPQGTSSDIQGTSSDPTGNSNTIDSFLDSNTDLSLSVQPEIERETLDVVEDELLEFVTNKVKQSSEIKRPRAYAKKCLKDDRDFWIDEFVKWQRSRTEIDIPSATATNTNFVAETIDQKRDRLLKLWSSIPCRPGIRNAIEICPDLKLRIVDGELTQVEGRSLG